MVKFQIGENMKTKIFLILFLGVLSCTFCAFAHENKNYNCKIESSDIPQQARVYVQAERIHINAEGLFVEVAENLYQVSQICQDENGFYVPHAEFWVKCPNGHPNPPWRIVCQVCGLPL
jgi:hypothetical protein